MPRYVAIARKPKASYFDGDLGCEIHAPEHLTIYEAEDAPRDTGLLDANGTPLYRMSDRQPIGFDLTTRAIKR